MSTDYGFKRNPGLEGIKPKVEPEARRREDAQLVEEIDRVGERHGFESRESVKAMSRRKSVGPTAALNVRCPVRVLNPFIRFCEAERLTYWEAIERLMQLAEVDENGRRR